MPSSNSLLPVRVENLELRYGETLVQRGLTFTINPGDIFIVMGGSGCGKSTLLKHLIGLMRPTAGRVCYGATDFWAADEEVRQRLMRGMGVLYQQGALWSSMTVSENVALPLEIYTGLDPATVREVVAGKLALVGLSGCESLYPAQLSGGMRKRAALARAMALDPEILLFDEPSAGLDPVSARMLDDLIRELRDSLNATVVVVTHVLDSIFAIGTNSIFLDDESRTMIASGDPRWLRDHAESLKVRHFLTCQEPAATQAGAVQ